MATSSVSLPPSSSDVVRRRAQSRGRSVRPEAAAEVRTLWGSEPPARDELIEALHRIQDRFGQIALPHLAALADWMRLSQSEVFEVATFYHHFDVVRDDEHGRVPAAPRLTVRVCDGPSCAMQGADGLLTALQAGLPADVRVVAAPCMGRCEQAPVAMVHRRTLGRATEAAVRACIVRGDGTPEPVRALERTAYEAGGGYALLRECLAGRRDPLALIDELERSGLRGLGGAGFPAGRKWRLVRAQPAPRLMAVNIDEGEPGTFKDRWFLERDPHRFLEGLFVAAWAVGVERVFVYLRDEYHPLRDMLSRELQSLRDEPPAPGLPEVVLRRGAGAYVCGEESAMIESIEGRRGWPRLRPPYVAEVGLFGRPTLEHNFETLFSVRAIVERGAAWFAAQGRHGRKGLRSFSVSGRVREPGVKVAPAGITLRELIDEFCGGMLQGHELYGYLPGGASGGILPARLADVPLDFDTLQPHGAFIGSAAVIVLSQHDRAVDVARRLMRFFEHESCGQCTPCRVGTAQARRLVEQPCWDEARLAELSEVMRDASICGLGQAAPNPFDSVLRYFRHELDGGEG